MCYLTETELLGDRPDTVVVIDETYFTRKKRARGGFEGRTTESHVKIVLGMYVNRVTRKGTGRCKHVLIPDKDKVTIEACIQRYVSSGATVWIDGFGSYQWMAFSEFDWFFIVHKDKEFAVGPEGYHRITTNSAEGLFARVKRHIRTHHGRFGRGVYGEHLGDFMWRERFLSMTALAAPDGSHDISWRTFAFWKLCDTLASIWQVPNATAISNGVTYRL